MFLRYRIPDFPEPTKYPLYSPRGARMATRTWSVQRPVCILLIVHGERLHSGYFDELATRLNEEDIYVAAYDQVCHGYSDPEPGAPKGCVHVFEFDDLVEDMFAAVRWVRTEAGDTNLEIPLFVMGESFGGLQVLAAGLDLYAHEPVLVAGVIVLGGLIEAAPGTLPPRPFIHLLSCLATCYPMMKMPVTTDTLSFDTSFGDPNWALVVRSDPAAQTSLRPTLGRTMVVVATSEVVASRAGEWNMPLLAIHSKDDCRARFAAVKQFVDRAGPRAEGFWVEDTVGHQLLQDRSEISKTVMDRISGWIQTQLFVLAMRKGLSYEDSSR